MTRSRRLHSNDNVNLLFEELEARRLLSTSGTLFPGNECAPVFDLDLVEVQQVRAGARLEIDLLDSSIGGTVTDANDDGSPTNDVVRFYLDDDEPGHPAGTAIMRSGLFSWNPVVADIGTHTVKVLAIDSGTPALADADTFMIEVLPGNSAPTFTVDQSEATVDEDSGTHTIDLADDPSPGPADEAGQTTNFEVTSVVLSDNFGLDIFTAEPTIAADGQITFTLAENANGKAEITYVLRDDGGTANGGTDRSAPETFTLTVDALNDDPTISVPTAQTIPEDTTQSITGISISDVDVDETAGGEVQVHLVVTDGTIALTDASGNLDFATGGTAADKIKDFTGSLADVNAALATLTYRGEQDFEGSDTLEVEVKDLGNTGAGGGAPITNSVAINVAPVNDEPVVTVPAGPLMAIAGEAKAIDGISVTDVDAGTGTLTATVFAATGMVSSGAQSGSSITETGTLDEINQFLAVVNYQGASVGGDDTLTVTVSDLGNTGSGGTKSDTKTVAINVLVDNNQRPIIDPIADVTDARRFSEIHFVVTATDPENDSLTFIVNVISGSPSMPPTLTDHNDDTATFAWTPGVGDVGTFEFEILVTDDGFLPKGDTRTFQITVSPNFVVDTLVDENDDDFSAGDFSLREAIRQANMDANVDTIMFDPALAFKRIYLDPTLGELAITESLNIDASMLFGSVTVDADSRGFRVFNISDADIGTMLDVTLNNLTISGGNVTGDGGGILSEENLTLIGSRVTGNSASGNGGGISASGSLALQKTAVDNNYAGTNGGGITTTGGFAIESSSILDNTADENGGGWHISGSAATQTLFSSTISGNRASAGGGAYFAPFSGAAPVFAHSTIADNQAVSGAGGISAIFGVSLPSLRLDHVILASNRDDTESAPDLKYSNILGGTIVVSSSLIGNNAGSGLMAGNPDGNGNLIGDGSVAGGAGIIDPKLLPLGLYGGTIQTHALAPDSPAIDSGLDTATAGAGGIPEFDQRGEPFTRVADGDDTDTTSRIDIGAYEFQRFAPDSFVVTTLADEVDFSNTDVSLREAIMAANGSVNPAGNVDEITFASAMAGGTIELDQKKGALRIQEGVTINASTLSGGITINAGHGRDGTANTQDGSEVFYLSDEDGSNNFDAILNNLTITGGDTPSSGGGILALENLTLIDSTVTGNAAAGGGGVFVMGNANITGSTISGNNSQYNGGGVYVMGNANITGSTISGNNSQYETSGAAFRGDVTITSSTISGNNSQHVTVGGAAFYANATITSSTISGNNSQHGTGGAAFFANATITSSTISGNNSQDGTGGAAFHSDATITSSTISDNNSQEGTGGAAFYANATITSSTISGNNSQYGTGGAALHANATITSSTFSDNKAGGNGGGIAVHGESVSIKHSTIVNNTADKDNGGSGSGGGIYAGNPDLVLILDHTIIAQNSDLSGKAPDLDLTSNAPTTPPTITHSLIGDNTGSGLTAAPVGSPDGDGNLIGTFGAEAIDPLLDPLAFNGGPTQTHALQAGSPAIDAGEDPDTEMFDQRSAPFVRLFDGDNNGTSIIDIGAYELRSFLSNAFDVTTVVDELDYSNNNLASPVVSLREAINNANGAPGAQTITIVAGLSGTIIDLELGEIIVSKELTVNGPDGDITVDAQNKSQVFNNLVVPATDFVTNNVTLVNQAAPLVLAASAFQPKGQRTPAPLVDSGLVEPLRDEALDRLAAAGVGAELLAKVASTPIFIQDLAGNFLGLTRDNAIYLDDDAAGRGWFVDDSPADDAEFSALDGAFAALSTGPAAGRVDLFSVLLHEMGHVLGHDDLEDVSAAEELMFAELAPGIRKMVDFG